MSDVHKLKLQKVLDDEEFSYFLLRTPYIFNMNHKLVNPKFITPQLDLYNSKSVRRFFADAFELYWTPMISNYNKKHGFEHVIDFYRPDVFFKEFKDIGPVLDEKALPFVGDDPLTPDIELVKNPEYYYYQRLL